MGEPAYQLHVRRTQHYGQDWTPQSACTPYSAVGFLSELDATLEFLDSQLQVSSFNLPAQYDSSLITPVTLTQSPSLPSRIAPASLEDKEIKLSPVVSSPDYQLFSGDEDYRAGPMKHKSPTGNLQISTSDSSFPASPYPCVSPYWGAFGVSATPASGNSATHSSPSMNPSSLNRSPNVNSAGGTSQDSRRSRQPTPGQSATSYRSQTQAPILIAPNPLTLRGATRPGDCPYRSDHLQSLGSTPGSNGSTQGAFSEPLGSLPARRKRKTPPRNASEGEIILSGEISHEEQVLMQLAEQEDLPWKEVCQRFNELTGKNMKVPALQMRKKRLRERLRVWTDSEVIPSSYILSRAATNILSKRANRAQN